MSRGRENRRVLRLRLDVPCRVVMGSIGTDVRYDMFTRDISNNGFFLDYEKPGRFPFTNSSIMEVWLELEPGVTIFLNGKMARVVYPNDPGAQESGPGIGVRIVQIDKDEEKKLVDFINRRTGERKSEHDVA